MSIATAVIVVGAAAFGLSRSSGGEQSTSSAAVARTTNPSGSESSLLVPTSVPLPKSVALQGDAQASCIASSDARTLGDRSFAFDGTVVSIAHTLNEDPYVGVKFSVNEWFAGGGLDTVTIEILAPHRSKSLEGSPEYDTGSRLLIAGEPRWGGAPLDSPIAWMCGFSRTYDTPTADTWRDTFARSSWKISGG